jgi:chemotaxis signal transduction protein
MAPDLSEKLLGIDTDDDRTRDSDEGEQERLVQFIFVGVGEHRLALPVDAVRTITEPAAELTRVPRAPPAIEGLMDLRGEITAVIDPRVHFPVTESRSGRERLLVLDRTSDQQSVAIRVDEVIGVETVAESDIVDTAAIESSEFSGDILEHPLLVALVTQEREPRVDTEPVVPEKPADDAASAVPDTESSAVTGAGGSAALSSVQGTSGGIGDSVGEAFEIEPAEDTAEQDDGGEDDESPQEIVVEATALIDVDRLLLASGHSD